MCVSILFRYSIGVFSKTGKNLDYQAITQKRLVSQKWAANNAHEINLLKNEQVLLLVLHAHVCFISRLPFWYLRVYLTHTCDLLRQGILKLPHLPRMAFKPLILLSAEKYSHNNTKCHKTRLRTSQRHICTSATCRMNGKGCITNWLPWTSGQ